MASSVPSSAVTVDHISIDTAGQPIIFNEFLKWYEDRQTPRSNASITHSGTSFVGFTHSNFIVWLT